MSSLGVLAGKVALVTGSSRGIGRAIALRFAREGAAVVVNYVRSAAGADEVVAAIVAQGGRAVAVRTDVSARAEVDALFAAALDRLGPIDVLVNNAGAFFGGAALATTDAALDGAMAVNVKGALYCAQAAAAHMKGRGGGAIVNVSSIAGQSTATPDQTAYALAKAAQNALTKRLALELGRFDITVNAICPGPVRTDMAAGGDSPEEFAAKLQLLARKAVLGRIAEPDDIAGVALFFASGAARMVTGQVLTVDGGRTDFFSRSG